MNVRRLTVIGASVTLGTVFVAAAVSKIMGTGMTSEGPQSGIALFAAVEPWPIVTRPRRLCSSHACASRRSVLPPLSSPVPPNTVLAVPLVWFAALLLAKASNS